VERRLLVAPSEQTGTPSWDSKLPRCKTPRRRKPRILLLRNTRFVCDLSLENIVISLMIVFVIHFFCRKRRMVLRDIGLVRKFLNDTKENMIWSERIFA